MMHKNPKFWFSLIGLLLMVSGFLVQQTTRIPFVENLIAGDAAEAKRALEGLLTKSASQGRDLGFGGNLEGRPAISSADPGFTGLSKLYSALIATEAKEGDRIGKISRFIDACSLVPDKRGYANLVVVEWEHGVKTQTSYEEIRELIAKNHDDSILPWQYCLFGIGLFLAVAMVWLTYFTKSDERSKDVQLNV